MSIRRVLFVLFMLAVLVPFAPAHRVAAVQSGGANDAALKSMSADQALGQAITPSDEPQQVTPAQTATKTVSGERTLRRVDTRIAAAYSAPSTTRAGHTATRLRDGRVLIVGGINGSYLRSAELYDPATQAFTRTGDLRYPRSQHTATLLADGRVLIAGGRSTDTNFLTAVELYDPATGTFTEGAPLLQARAGHSATLLPDGDVLIVGGANGGMTPSESIERYDPATGSFSAAGELLQARTEHMATLLGDGTLLITGGFYTISLASVERYDPATATSTRAASMKGRRQGHTATLLQNGTVLVVGGQTDSFIQAIAETYNPSTQSWTQVDTQLPIARHSATLLTDGRVLITGGNSNGAAATNRSLYYMPSTRTFDSAGSMVDRRLRHTATLLEDGTVLVVAGSEGGAEYQASAERFNPSNNTYTFIDSRDTQFSGHTATRLADGRVLIAGGVRGTPTLIYDPATDVLTNTGALQLYRQGHTATLLRDGTVLIVGGTFDYYSTRRAAELYDPTTGTFTVIGQNIEARAGHTATLLPDGKVVIVGGFYQNYSIFTPRASAEVYDPTTRTFTEVGSLPGSRYRHTATLLPDGKLLVAGGVRSQETVPYSSTLLYDPAPETFAPTAPMNYTRASHTATLMQNGKVLVAGGYGYRETIARAEVYDPATATWTLTGRMQTPRSGHTATLLFDGTVYIVGGSYAIGVNPERYDPATGQFETLSPLMYPRIGHTATRLNDGSVLIVGTNGEKAERTRVVETNTFRAMLTVPTGWITTTKPTVTFTGTTMLLPLASGTLNNGQPLPAQSGEPVTATTPALAQGRNQRVALSLRDHAGNIITNIVTTTVDVDTINPASQLSALPQYSRTTSTRLRWSGEDASSGIATYDVDVREGSEGAWTPLLRDTAALSTTFSGTDGQQYFFRVRAHDVAGNVEAWPSTYDAQTTFDTSAPIGTIDITFVGDAVQLLLTARDATSGVVDMRVGFAQNFANAPWEPYTSFKALQRPPGAMGCLIAQVQYRDAVGNISPIYAKPVPGTGCAATSQIFLPLVRR